MNLSLSNDSSLHVLVRGLFKQYITPALFRASSETIEALPLRRHCADTNSSSLSSVSVDNVESSNLVVFDDIARIRGGSELRTTLMIKKVPRKYTLEILRREIDRVLALNGCYDLLYLPVDSAKMTNRGYAFINLSQAKFVEVFVREFLNRPWSELNRRNKTAVIHWAYVQGRDATLAHIKTEVIDKENTSVKPYS